ncbi:hypothetical protein MTF65_00630 [Streptomyces sp. APSN-46.1]|uniref:hypothetical protein n=1 Tax=Streptomyces sp. APSN-46.1 TaxID=2929049 RepID=UPI001FB3F084|nr:hypothetical protein [Streptomyces sp. APSN-46.1]MCJ1675888.1 hypothetical protein [Streptomyces sp. APSN-46.1]
MPPAGAPSSGAPPHHEPRGGPGAAPVIVQAPALEALKAVDAAPERPGHPEASAAASGAGTGAAAAAASTGAEGAVPPAPGTERAAGRARGHDGRDGYEGRGGPDGRGGPEASEGRGGAGGEGHRDRAHQGKKPAPEVPRRLMRELPVQPADVCALGRRHGRWHPDSPEARICSGVHED